MTTVTNMFKAYDGTPWYSTAFAVIYTPLNPICHVIPLDPYAMTPLALGVPGGALNEANLRGL